jgi:hypothetical protein
MKPRSPEAKFYYVLYYIASIFMMVSLIGALISFAVEGLYWVRFGAWPEWSWGQTGHSPWADVSDQFLL